MYVDIGEALGLLATMEWVRELEFKKVIFCLDLKVVVDSLSFNYFENLDIKESKDQGVAS